MKTEIAQRWSELIEKTGKTKNEIATLAGVNKSNITNYCTGKYRAKQDTIYNVCRPLGINPSWLMGYDVPMESSPSPALPLSADEAELVGAWRKAGEPIKGAVRKLLDIPAPEDQREDVASFRSQAG